MSCFRKLRLAGMVSDSVGRYMSCFGHSSLRILLLHHTKIIKRNIYRCKIRHMFLIEAQSPQKRTEAREEVTRTQTSGCAEESIWRWVVTTGILCKRTHNLVLFVDSLWLYLAAPVFKQWHNLTLTGCKYKFNCI